MASMIEKLLAVADAYAEAKRLSESRLSTIVLNDGKALGRLRSGKDANTRTVENALRWFAQHWPDDAIWPAFVPRPVVEAPAEATA